MRRVFALAILPLLCSCGRAPEALEGPKAAIDETKTVPAGAEWNRQIIAKNEGVMTYGVETPAKFSLTLITDKGFKAVQARKEAGIAKSDVLFTKDFDPPSHILRSSVPAGSYWLMIRNNSDTAQQVRLIVWEPG